MLGEGRAEEERSGAERVVEGRADEEKQERRKSGE